MRKFVFWTGVLDALLGAGLFFPVLASRLMPSASPGFLLHLFAAVAVFLGIMLVFCSRDLPHRGTLALWEGVLRCCTIIIVTAYAFSGKSDSSMIRLGLFDLAIGVVYLLGLPRHLNRRFFDLLLDRQAVSSRTNSCT